MQPADVDSGRGSRLPRRSARLKLLGAIVLVAGTAVLPRRPDLLYLVPIAVLVGLWPLSRMPLLYALKRLCVVEFFILGIALLSLVTPSAAPLVLAALIKSNICVLVMMLLAWTTPFSELLQELRRLHLPAVMVTTLALMYRYGPVLAEESRRMERARSSRTFSRRRRLLWQNLASILGQLFIRSADRAERIYLAMCARGWK